VPSTGSFNDNKYATSYENAHGANEAADITISYQAIELSRGISIRVPAHWDVLSKATRQNLRAAGQAATERAGVSGPESRKDGLLAVNATPYPSGAMIRVSVTTPPEYTGAELSALTQVELEQVGEEFYSEFRKLNHQAA
jgi:hypothetical protein